MLSKKLLAACFERFDELLLYGEIANRSRRYTAAHSNSLNGESKQQSFGANKITFEAETLTKRRQWQFYYFALLQQADASETTSCEAVKILTEKWEAKDEIYGYLSILETFMGGLEKNLQNNLLLQLEAKVGTDFIDQAERIFSSGFKQFSSKTQSNVFYVTASVALAGAVLEKVLYVLSREKLQLMPATSLPELERLNQLVSLLRENDVIDATIAQQICEWLNLRAKAITEPEQIEPRAIQRMLDGIRHLLGIVEP